jgi:hypothetical protein
VRILLSTGFLAACAAFLWGQEDQKALEEKRDAKLKEEWLKKVDWITDYDKAREAAKKEKKLIFAYFTRSYAG